MRKFKKSIIKAASPPIEELAPETTPKPAPAPVPEETALARPVAPEDVRLGDYVICLEERSDYFRCKEFGGVERLTIYSPDTWPTRGRVTAVALPFVLVEQGGGDPALLDARLHRLARLPTSFGEAMRPKKKDDKSDDDD